MVITVRQEGFVEVPEGYESMNVSTARVRTDGRTDGRHVVNTIPLSELKQHPTVHPASSRPSGVYRFP